MKLLTLTCLISAVTAAKAQVSQLRTKIMNGRLIFISRTTDLLAESTRRLSNSHGQALVSPLVSLELRPPSTSRMSPEPQVPT